MQSIIIWFTRNDIAANLLMVLLLVAGTYALLYKIPLEVFPKFDINMVNVAVPYRGATPEEVEEGVTVRIEEAIQDIEGIKKISSRSLEGSSQTQIEIDNLYDIREVMNDIKTRIDAINTFPVETERPVISEALEQDEVISVVVAGDVSERELRLLGETVRDDLLRVPGITQVLLDGVRPYEVSIEVPENILREYNLTLAQVAERIADSSLDLSAGNIKTQGGEVFIRTKGQAYTQRDFENIAVLVREDGTRLLLGDIAKVQDGFEEDPLFNRFNGKPAVLVEVYRVGAQSAIEVADLVKQYVKEHAEKLPQDVSINYWRDRSRVVKLRLETLVYNAIQGGILVLILLTLFLRPGVAFWVFAGIPISFMAAFAFMPLFHCTLNLISMFAFILVLGIVVDDAIVVGEAVYSKLNTMDDAEQAAIEGSLEVAVPVTFGVLTTVVAFLPLLMLEGQRGQIFSNIPLVVIPVLLSSLIESKLILPAHLKHIKPRNQQKESWGTLSRLQASVADGLETMILKYYYPVLKIALRHRYLALSIVIGIVIIALTCALSGWMRFVFFPTVQSEVARASLTMPTGTAFEITDGHVERIMAAAEVLKDKYRDKDTGESIITNVLGTSGSDGGDNTPQSNKGRVWFEITPPEERKVAVTSSELVREWRNLIGIIPGVERINYRAEMGHGGEALDFQLSGQSYAELQAVSDELREHLRTYPAVFDISDSMAGGKEELQLSIKPGAEALGLKMSDLARQVRQAFFGFEVQRIQRGHDDVRVIVRYPAAERRSIASLNNMYIRTQDGTEVPFTDVAEVKPGHSPTTVYRINRQRVLDITADVNKDTGNIEAIKSETSAYLQKILLRHPAVRFSMEGEAKEQREMLTSLLLGLGFVLLAIYGLLAIPLKSYFQPLVVMSVIPVGAVGAFLGHWILGMPLTIMSLIGMLALAGVVVNDSLVLVDYMNRQRSQGHGLMDAVLQAGITRFRPVLLISLTTFVGLVPIIFEKSTQAQFLIPTAVSLGFGAIFATFITMIIVPVNYLIMEDIRGFFAFGKSSPKNTALIDPTISESPEA